MNDEDDFPQIGDRKKGMILVCMGDDCPDQWIDWLEALIDEFKQLQRVADKHGLDVDAGPDYKNVQDWRTFCEALGIMVDTQFWEGSMVSGMFQMGWIQARRVSRAQKTGNTILTTIKENFAEQLR